MVHVSTLLPEHCVAPDEHALAHTPLVHTLEQDAPLFCQVPVASQVCG